MTALDLGGCVDDESGRRSHVGIFRAPNTSTPVGVNHRMSSWGWFWWAIAVAVALYILLRPR
jgi:hypothetical protein